MRKVSDQPARGLSRPPLRAPRPYSAPLRSLLAALREHDAYTYRHSLRTVRLSLLLGRACGLTTLLLRVLCLGALVHDAGKLFVPWGVLHKPGRLTEAEWEAMRRHPVDGARLLFGALSAPAALRVVAEHHERWDGGGYPSGLRAGRIDPCARIVAVADAFDAITSERPYRRARGYDEAAEELGRCAGSQFDPQVVEAFGRLPRELLERVIGGGAPA